jgi:predicted RNA-binding Zn ribbon-like protein
MPDLDSPASSPVAFPFVGDALCLDFLNTVEAGRDLLTDFASYVRWLTEAGVLSAVEAVVVVESWGSGRGIAAALAEVKSLRDTLRAAVHAISSGERVPPATLKVLNPLLARSPACAELVSDATGRIHKRFRLQWQEPADLLAPVAESAADLLSGADYSLIHQCAGSGCTLFFYDRTKNHRRRWCSVAVCGNRAKVAAYRARRSKAA